MQNIIAEKVQRWALQEQGDLDFNAIHAEIEYLISHRFDQYVPTTGPAPDFRARLAAWLNNEGVSDEDQKIMFRIVPNTFFLGREEFVALQRAALLGPVYRWLVDEAGIAFTDANRDNELDTAVTETWFCPITDSAHISDFYHVNNLTGVEHRVEWRAMAKLAGGDSTLLLRYMTSTGLRRVVLVEDVVGSGSQMNDLIPLLSNLPPNIKVLLVPLVVCPVGAEAGRTIQRNLPNVQFAHVLELPQHSFVAETPDPNEPQFFGSIRDLIKRLYLLVSGGVPEHPAALPYGPFGWRRTGALIVTYSNAPDNTIPLIQHHSVTWDPLFPRSSRV